MNKSDIVSNKKFFRSKGHILRSLLTGFAVPFLLLICSSLSVYFSNSEEFVFELSDFLPAYIILSLIMFIAVSAVLILTNGRLHKALFSLCAGGIVCTYLQTFATTLSFQGLPGDGTALPPSSAQKIINLIIWIVLMATFLIGSFLFSKTKLFSKVLCFMIILVTFMQVVSLVPTAIEASQKGENSETFYLSEENLLEVSSKDNIIVFVLDCFDRNFYLDLVENYPEITEEFKGFTYYDDNIANYPRTFPATVSMISGMNTDFSLSRKEYFKEAYSTSPLLKDLKNNDYKINLYTPSFHGYDNADVFEGKVDNVCLSEGSRVTSQTGFYKRMLLLSSYFWLPDFMKSESISANTFNEVVTLEGDSPKYNVTNDTDARIYEELLQNGLTTQDEQNNFTFLHIRGCHSPYAMDENCKVQKAGSVTHLQQTRGAFRVVCEYLRQMKELGIYKDATIIITGDHADLKADSDTYTEPMLTALLVKNKGEDSTPLKTSKAPVSQANLHASVVKGSQLTTSHDYGKAYDEIAEGEAVTRTHYFQLHTGSERKDKNITYKITGDGTLFANWEIISENEIGYTYK